MNVQDQATEAEIFLWNTCNIANFPSKHFIEFKSLRLGEQAFDIKGNPILNYYKEIRPVFIHKSEYLAMSKKQDEIRQAIENMRLPETDSYTP